MSQLLDTKQVAELLNISMPNLYKMIWNDEIPAIKVGGSYRFDAQEVIQYFKDKTRQGRED